MKPVFKFLLGGLLMVSTTACASLHCAGRALNEAYHDPQAQALVNAAVRGNADDVAVLVKRGANVNHLEDGAVPMLLWTICADNVDGFEALLHAGADPNLGGTGRGRGDGKGHDVKEDGSIIYPGWSAMVMAGGTGRPDFLRLALKHGGNLDAKKGAGGNHRPLLQAAYYGLFENTKILIAAGANVNVHDEQFVGYTAPEKAIGVTGSYDIALWLLDHGYTHDLQRLAAAAEGSYVPLDSDQQRWKEKLIDQLRARGLEFPASPLVKNGLKTRQIPPEHVNDLVYGRRSVWDYPEKKP